METIIISMETGGAGNEATLERHLGYWLRLVSNQVSGSFARALQARQVSVAEWVVLSVLSERSEATPAQLADTIGLTRGAVSKVLDKLEAKKWTTRRTSPQDQRVQLLSITPRGHRILPELFEIANQNDARVFECLSDEEARDLRRLLQKTADFHSIREMPTK
jgi:DNA-binding MarR family transcriptional regulator